MQCPRRHRVGAGLVGLVYALKRPSGFFKTALSRQPALFTMPFNVRWMQKHLGYRVHIELGGQNRLPFHIGHQCHRAVYLLPVPWHDIKHL